MKISGISSATANPPPSTLTPDAPVAGAARLGFALAGPSVVLDPRTHAVRRDLADVRLAEYVFAPHYAAPMARTVALTVTLMAERDTESETLATLQPGELFEVLDLVGQDAWGIAVVPMLVGYVRAAALGGELSDQRIDEVAIGQ